MHNIILKLGILIIAIAAITVWVSPPKKTSTNPAYTLGCAGPITDKGLSKGFDPTEMTGEFLGKIVQVPVIDFNKISQVLGEASDKRIEVDLARQRVYAYEGNNRIFEFVVSTGKWYPTPKGTFWIARKVRAQKMSGGNKAIGTYYYLPNVPWVMFFGNNQIPWSRGFSLHGTYWHNNFGHPMSHGCVNMKIPDSEAIYNWAPVGTKVVIY